jgi:hypothetical protein
MSSKLEEIEKKIAAAEAMLTDAENAKNQDLIISIQNRLTELQKTLNILLAREVRPALGEPPSNKFLFYLKLQFIAICRVPTVLLTLSLFFGAFVSSRPYSWPVDT